jgi:hypothetical protein
LSNGTIAAIECRVRLFNLAIFLFACSLAVSSNTVRAEGLTQSKSHFVYKERSGKVTSARIIRRYWTKRIVHPFAHVDPRIDPKLMRAAGIAKERASARSHFRCWQYVKEALVAAGVVPSYPKTAYAAEAGQELMQKYGFRPLTITDPYKAPVGAVLVYGNRSRGHVELRTRDGFVSDYHSKNRCFYRLLAIYGKFSS